MRRGLVVHPFARSGSRARRIAWTAVLFAAVTPALSRPAHTERAARVQFLFTSDQHYGLRRRTFRGHSDVDAHAVNAALVAAMNAVSDATFPDDDGVGAGERVGPVDFVADGGDIANREERAETTAIQSAAVSWAQFESDYLDGLRLRDAADRRTRVFAVPGNHDVSNAIGFYKPMDPARDGSALAGLYNLMMRPDAPREASAVRYPRDRVQTSRDLGGVHVVFLTIWPDTAERAWLTQDLQRVPGTTPVIIVTHDPPDAESKHFTNPNGAHDINGADRFENLLVDPLADGTTTTVPSTREQRALELFLRDHPNVTAYFHGDANWNEFYDWTGPDRSVALHTFRVDSPMKGKVSGTDETRLSFQVATIDLDRMAMTVRECLWNTAPDAAAVRLGWGDARTVDLGSRSAR